MQESFINFYKMQENFYKIFHAGSLKFLNFIKNDPCVHACAWKKFLQSQPGRLQQKLQKTIPKKAFGPINWAIQQKM